MMCLSAQLYWYARLPNFPCYCFGCSYEEMLDYIDAHCKVKSPLKKCPGIIDYKMLKRLWKPGSLYIDFLQRGSESVSPFHLFHLFIDWWGTGVSSWCWCGCWEFVWCFGWFASFNVLAFRLTMTTLAQLHDCHCCNDERSKKKR